MRITKDFKGLNNYYVTGSCTVSHGTVSHGSDRFMYCQPW